MMPWAGSREGLALFYEIFRVTVALSPGADVPVGPDREQDKIYGRNAPTRSWT